MSSKHAGDIMVPLEKYPHTPHTYTLKQAVRVFSKSKLEVREHISLPRSLLVFDDKDQLLGIVRRRDILKGLEPKFLRMMPVHHRKELFNVEVDPNLVDLSSGTIAHAMFERADMQVSEVMQPIMTTVKHDDHLAKVIYKMINYDLNLLPVLEGLKVIGVVRSVDVFREIADILLEES